MKVLFVRRRCSSIHKAIRLHIKTGVYPYICRRVCFYGRSYVRSFIGTFVQVCNQYKKQQHKICSKFDPVRITWVNCSSSFCQSISWSIWSYTFNSMNSHRFWFRSGIWLLLLLDWYASSPIFLCATIIISIFGHKCFAL